MSGEWTTFDRYELRSKLGSGASGEVYRAFDPQLGREVALKLLAAREATPRQLERFEREGAITAHLQHPGILQVFASGSRGGRPFLVYELVPECRTLSEVVSGLGAWERVEYVIAAAEALGYAHAQGVVHRDVKLENLLVDGVGRLRVGDFGLASLRGLDRLTVTGALVGTPLTMSPEQLSGQRAAVGPWSDVWSLGVVLYRVLTGSYPFEGSSLLELSARVAQGVYVPMRELEPSLSPELERVVACALSVDPEARYADGGALAEALEEALAVPAGPSSGRAWLLSGLLVGAVTAGAVAVVASVGAESSRPPERASAPSPTPSSPIEGEAPEPVAPEVRPDRGQALRALMRAGRHAEVEALLREPLSRHERFQRGMARLEQGDLKGGAADLAQVGIGADGLALAAQAWLRFEHWKAGFRNPAQALDLARKAAKRAPNEVPVLLVLARVTTEMLAFGEARAALDAVARRAPGHWRISSERARIAVQEGDRATAWAEIERAQRRTGATPPVSLFLHEVALAAAQDDVTGVTSTLDRAVRLHPHALRLRMIRAVVWDALGQESKGAAELEYVRQRDPKSLAALAKEVRVPRDVEGFLSYQELLKQARQAYARIQNQGPESPTPIRIRSLSGAPWAEIAADFDRLERAFQGRPKRQHRAQMWRLQLMRYRGRFQEVVERGKAGAGLPPPFKWEARYHLGMCAQWVGDAKQGYLALQSLFREAPRSAYGLAAVAALNLGRQSWAQAVAAAKQALASVPSLVDARLTLAYCLAMSGQAKAAEPEFRRCAQVAPDLPRYQLLTGLLAERRGDSKGAFRALSRFVRQIQGRTQAPAVVLLARAFAATRRCRFAVALADYDELLRRRPKRALYRIGRGLARHFRGEEGRARLDWQAASRLEGYEQALETFSKENQRRVRAALEQR